MNTTKKIILAGLFAALSAIGAFIKVPIPVLPFTLQLLFTTLAGLILGGKLGAISVFCYIIIGLLGFPVFTNGGGPAYVLQPTFGYLAGFCAGAFATGKIARAVPNPSLKRLLAATFTGLAIVYALGIAYYWFIYQFYIGSPLGFWTLFLYCFLLAIPGDIVLCIVTAVIGKRLIPIVSYSN